MQNQNTQHRAFPCAGLPMWSPTIVLPRPEPSVASFVFFSTACHTRPWLMRDCAQMKEGGPCAFLSLSTACHTWLTRDYAQTREHATLRTAQSKRREPNRKKAKEQTNKTHSTGPSHVVPHHSTTPARASLTSLFGWEAVILACMAVCVWQRSQLEFIGTTL